MRSIWKGTISFGLVNIPIALGVATQRSDPKFRTLDRKTLQPVKQQLFSPGRDETVDREDTIKGYEVGKDRYLPMTDEELDSLSVERRRTIDILGFVDIAEVDPVYYDRSYYIAPQEHAEKPYALLLRAMKDTGKAAVGKIVLSSKEHLTLLRPTGDALVIELLFYPEDVRPKDEIEDSVREVELSDQELAMAEQLVASLTRPFDPAEFENEHKRELLSLVERKLAGEEPVVAVEEAPAASPVPDLMSALKASLEQAQGVRPKGQGRKRKAPAGDGAGSDGAPAKRSNGSGAKEPKAGGGRRTGARAGSKSG